MLIKLAQIVCYGYNRKAESFGYLVFKHYKLWCIAGYCLHIVTEGFSHLWIDLLQKHVSVYLCKYRHSYFLLELHLEHGFPTAGVTLLVFPLGTKIIRLK